jgi:hypothetical protein
MPRQKQKYSNNVAAFPLPQPPSHNSVVIMPRLLSIPDAAKYLSATTWFVEELLRSGEVKSFLQGKRRVVDMRELDKYIDRRNSETTNERLTNRAANFGKVAA